MAICDHEGRWFEPQVSRYPVCRIVEGEDRSVDKPAAKFIFIALTLMMAACGTKTKPGDIRFQTPASAVTPMWGPTIETFVHATRAPTEILESNSDDGCASSVDILRMNQRDYRRVQGGSFPNQCDFSCLCVPEGATLEIGITGFVVDLDIFADTDSSILQLEDHGRWESDAFGIVDEQISIRNPNGCYHLKVCSYEGQPSSFILWNSFTP
jgi:hypothetical protein